MRWRWNPPITGPESFRGWYWLVDGLRNQGREVRLANPAEMDQYAGLKASNDASDAGWLAEQLRLGNLPESYVYPPQVRPIRDALRRRMLIVRQRTQSLLSLESLFARQGLVCPTVAESKGWGREQVTALHLDSFTELQVVSLLELVRKQDRLAHWIEQAVLKAVKPKAEFQRIEQVSGIGPVLGLVVVLESGDFARFPSAGDYAWYCRKVNSQRWSTGRKKGLNNRNPAIAGRYLAGAYAEAAVHAIRCYGRIAAWYVRKKRWSSKCGMPVALNALACKLAKAAWHVMRGKDFDETMLFG